MQIVKLDAIDSTNAFIKRAVREKELDSDTIVVAKDQYEGRGQMGTTWHSEPAKNLTFSVLKKLYNYKATEQFYLNMLVCKTIFNSLKELQIPNLSIKWPNDIMSGSTKVCGVLIETIIQGEFIKYAVIGIGLNVNQTNFPDLAGVSSLSLLIGKTFDLDEVLQILILQLKKGFLALDAFDFERMQHSYEQDLFLKDTLATFDLKDGSIQKGCIRGITREGKLRVEFDKELEFGFKELRLMYELDIS